MKPSLFKISAFVLLTLLLTTMSNAQNKSDTTVIKGIINDEVVSWNNGDAITYSQRFSENGTFTNILGMFYTGQKEFLARHEEIFKGKFYKTIMHQNIVSLQFVRPDVAIVETITWITGFSKDGPPPGAHLDAKGRLFTRLLQVMVKVKANWEIMVYHNVDLKPGATIPDVDAK